MPLVAFQYVDRKINSFEDDIAYQDKIQELKIVSSEVGCHSDSRVFPCKSSCFPENLINAAKMLVLYVHYGKAHSQRWPFSYRPEPVFWLSEILRDAWSHFSTNMEASIELMMFIANCCLEYDLLVNEGRNIIRGCIQLLNHWIPKTICEMVMSMLLAGILIDSENPDNLDEAANWLNYVRT